VVVQVVDKLAYRGMHEPIHCLPLPPTALLPVWACIASLVALAAASNQADTTGSGPGPDALSIWQKLFGRQRQLHLEAVHRISRLSSVSLRLDTLRQMSATSLKVLDACWQILDQFGYSAGMAFPQANNPQLRDAVSQIHENVALFAELLLRVPQTQQIYSQNERFRTTFGQSLQFVRAARFLDASVARLVDSVTQEIAAGLPSCPDDATTSESDQPPPPLLSPKSKQARRRKWHNGPRLSGGHEL